MLSNQGWNCPNCTFINKKGRKKCEMCFFKYSATPRRQNSTTKKRKNTTNISNLHADNDEMVLSLKACEEEKKTSKRIKINNNNFDSSSSNSTTRDPTCRVGSMTVAATITSSFTPIINKNSGLLLKEENQYLYLTNPHTSFLNVLARIAVLTQTSAAAAEEEVKEVKEATTENPTRYDPNNNKINFKSSGLIGKKKEGREHEHISRLRPGSLIRYGFENSPGKELQWFVGIIANSQAKKKSYYYDILFDDGDELCVQLNPHNNGKYWEKIKDVHIKRERTRFDRLVRTTNPDALDKMNRELEYSSLEPSVNHQQKQQPKQPAEALDQQSAVVAFMKKKGNAVNNNR